MRIIPAIDLIDGQCVRLYQGQYDKVTQYQQSPLELALSYQQQGATCLHLVDLDGAKQKKPVQLDLIGSICQALSLPVQSGGGIRTLDDAWQCFDVGIAKLVIGSLSVNNKTLVASMIERFGAERFVVALDVSLVNGLPLIMTHAWQQQSGKTLWDIVNFYQALGIGDVLCTDIACDGTMAGPNFDLYRQAIKRFPKMAWQASGGIRDYQDLNKLKELNVSGAILGRALYEGTIKVSEV